MGICLPLKRNRKSIADESLRLSEKVRLHNLKHMFPGTGEERGHKGRFSPYSP